jgi:tetratricopeptide (TPR) repeat protein
MSMHKRLLQVLRRNFRQALNRRQLAQAAEVLERLREEDPLSVETRGMALEYMLWAGRREEGAALLSQLLRSFPDSARIHYLAGRLSYQEKDYRAALRHFTESLRIHPSWRTRRWLGKTHSQLGQLNEAEALLVELAPRFPAVYVDLAWVYERMDDVGRALACLEAYVDDHPKDAFAKAQRLRLRARASSPEDLVEEVENLRALGDDIPSELATTYVQRLLETGQGTEARRFIDESSDRLDRRAATLLAWVCYHLQAYDMALQLFSIALPAHLRDYKYLCAFESAAVQCHRIGEVIEHYAEHVEEEKTLHGWIKNLRRRFGDASGQ